ncbi:endonuclease/exonuclease/phosphatase family protein [Pedobacter gandavensis]|uniref:endonuclease/exonuclease/phosphatase family protein n=1 Tax=Pedobacter TaxID=84567 RepID=UPI001C99142A|nr:MULTISPECIES: endonuclease/exonuclease/phosphatase family protein [Pedobacter]WGQ09397.1 endonuclease/exonuclease/phosphatase family protein [Pedobacter gandavensis]
MKRITLFLFFMLATQFLQAQTALKIISYNVYNYFETEAARKARFVDWAKTQQADVIAYQELVNISGEELKALGKSIDHPYTALAKEKGYAVGISSKYPITDVKRVIEGMHHGFMAVKIKDLNFVVVHLSPFSHEKRREEVAIITDSLQRWSISKRILILGDLNSLSATDSMAYHRNDRLTPMLRSDSSSKISNANNGLLDYGIPAYLAQKGFLDTWTMKVKGFNFSYPTLVFGEVPDSSKERIDYIFVSPDLQKNATKPIIVKDGITDQLSDHYPLEILLMPPA